MKVYSVVFGHTRFLAAQYFLWCRFCSFMTEFVVVNNGPDHKEIAKAAYRLGLRTIDIQTPRAYTPSQSHGWAVTSTIKLESASCDGPMFFIDSDLFPIRKFEPVKAQLASRKKHHCRYDYPWAGALYLGDLPDRDTISAMPDKKSSDRRDHVDTGAIVHEYIEAHKGISIDWWSFRNVRVDDLPCDYTKALSYGWKILRECLLHFTCGTNWSKSSSEYVINKERLLFKAICEL